MAKNVTNGSQKRKTGAKLEKRQQKKKIHSNKNVRRNSIKMYNGNTERCDQSGRKGERGGEGGQAVAELWSKRMPARFVSVFAGV